MSKISEELYLKMKKFINEYEIEKMVDNVSTETNEEPYIETISIMVDKKYNPKYGDNRICECGHGYYRHFDSYEMMEPIGCKYCRCDNFKEKE